MSTPLVSTQLSGTLYLSQFKDGFWLHDTTRGMNLSIRAANERIAFVEALTYYQKRLTEVEKRCNALQAKVSDFIAQFVDDDSD